MEIEKARKPKVLVRTTFEPESTMFSDNNGENLLDYLAESSKVLSPTNLSAEFQ
jgi:hypothetical protein